MQLDRERIDMMSDQIVVALIGGVATVFAAVVGVVPTYRKKRGTGEGKTWRTYFFEIGLLGSAIVVAAALIAGSVYFWGASFSLELSGTGSTWDRTVKTPRTEPYYDQLNLTIRRDGSVDGESAAEIKLPDGTLKKSIWRVSGFLIGGRLALSYGTRDALSTGLGTYFLTQYGNDYVGYVVQKDKDAILMCPYATQKLPSAKRSREDWLRLYPGLKRECTNTSLNPDHVSPSS